MENFKELYINEIENIQVILPLSSKTQRRIFFIINMIKTNQYPSYKRICEEYLERFTSPTYFNRTELIRAKKALDGESEKNIKLYTEVIDTLFNKSYKSRRDGILAEISPAAKLRLKKKANKRHKSKNKSNSKRKNDIVPRWGDQRGTRHNQFIGFWC